MADQPQPARFELRHFIRADIVGEVESRLAAHMDQIDTVEQFSDVYFTSPGGLEVNIKLRGGQLDIKHLISTHDDYEQWQPDPFAELPSGFPLSQASIEHLKNCCSFAAIDRLPTVDALSFLVAAENDPAILVAHTHKQRHRYTRGNLAAELVHCCINGAWLVSVALESHDLHHLQHARSWLDLADEENVSYPRLLLHLSGLLRLPANNRARADSAAIAETVH